MGHKLRKHEVDRLLNVAIALGWESVNEKYTDDGVILELKRTLPPELMKLEQDLDIPSEPQ
jgi:hypothetical protein